jgi:acyl-CoA dehydrogenase
VAGWLVERGLAATADISVQPLTGGQSNPTFRIATDSGDYVLRKKPPGQLLASAHAIDREYRVMSALAGSAVPVPRMLAWCEDSSLLGTPFYVMEFLPGRVLADQSLPSMQPEARAAIYAEMNRVMAALHAVDWAGVGLAEYGRAGNYVARQLTR